MQEEERRENPSLEIFQKFDTDSSGFLSPKEWMAVGICFYFRQCIFLIGNNWNGMFRILDSVFGIWQVVVLAKGMDCGMSSAFL